MAKSASSPVAAPTEIRVSKVEGLKERSDFLREPVASELLLDTNYFSNDAVQILKFHGSYQQVDRDLQKPGQEKPYQMMLRTRSPGGFIPPQLYLTLDRLASDYGNETLRATTRQGFQLHGILKKNLKPTIAAIVKAMGSTLGACGDLNRNVMAPPAPYKNRPDYQLALTYANNIADLLTPQTGAYYEIWLDGEKVISAEEDPAVKAARSSNGSTPMRLDTEEPIYGAHYMPRKFKCAVTVPGDNSVDLFSQDLSLVVITDAKGQLEGFNIYAGGGLGRTHNKEETFARIADEIGFVAAADVYAAVKAIVAVQRDYGDRFDRRHSRMKYLINDWGVAKFRTHVEDYLGKKLEPAKPLPPWKYEDFLGWHEQGDGHLFLGLSIQNGRVHDQGDFKLRSALRQIVERFELPMLLTPHQNVLFYDIKPADRAAIETILKDCGVWAIEQIDPLERLSMACPAMPTCGLAITESERALPGFVERIRSLMERLGLGDESFVIRMTGCPNGCARPYMAELGFVGSAPSSYQVWLGGSPNQTRLAQPFVERMKDSDLESFLEPILVYFKRSRDAGESFGDFCNRVGFDTLRHFMQAYRPVDGKPEKAGSKRSGGGSAGPRHRIGIRDELYQQVQTLAADRGQSATALINEAIAAYLSQKP